MKQCNNSSVPVNNQCDSKRLLHLLPLQQSSKESTPFTSNNVHYVQKVDKVILLVAFELFCKSKVGCFCKKSIPITWTLAAKMQ
jgi:hypothetical protein